VFFITEKQKNPAGTLSFRETSIFKDEIKHASLCVHVRKFEFPAKTGPNTLHRTNFRGTIEPKFC